MKLIVYRAYVIQRVLDFRSTWWETTSTYYSMWRL